MTSPTTTPGDEEAVRVRLRSIHATAPTDLATLVRHRAGRQRRRRRQKAFAAGILVLTIAALAVTLAPHGDTRARVTTVSPPTMASPSTASTSPGDFPPQPVAGATAGYPEAQAADLTSACRRADGQPAAGAVLRAATHDSAGALLVITTTTGWETCNVPTGHTPQESGSNLFQTWAATDGWAKPGPSGPATAAAPTAAPDYFLQAPVEGVSEDSGRVGPVYRNTILGRTSPVVATVTGILPDGKQVSTPTHNGMFILDDVSPTEPSYSPDYESRIRGYNAEGVLIYQAPQESNPELCSVTPLGQAVTPPSTDGTPCSLATAWG